jgi:hypothetical protein
MIIPPRDKTKDMDASHIQAGLSIFSIQHYLDNFITERRIWFISWNVILRRETALWAGGQ